MIFPQHIVRHYAPILTHHRYHLRRFMSEVLGYVLRKAPLHMVNDCIASIVNMLGSYVAFDGRSVTDKVELIQYCPNDHMNRHSTTPNILFVLTLASLPIDCCYRWGRSTHQRGMQGKRDAPALTHSKHNCRQSTLSQH
jgi:hypothetical protein